MTKDLKYLNRTLIFIIIGFTTLIVGSLIWNIKKENDSTHEYSQIESIASYNKDLIYRRWTALQGGIYVPVSSITPPNPYLKFLPDRDVITTNGKKLTLVNPAYMTRLVYELGKNEFGVKGHITSLKPIRHENKADNWEKNALKRFETGAEEYHSIEKIDGKDYLRYMHVMKVENSCLKCHVQQGYQFGDIRGGISVSVPLEKYNQIASSKIRYIIITHVSIYLIILLFCFFGYKYSLAEIRKRNDIQNKLIMSKESLKIQNEELRLAKEHAEESDRLKTAFLQNMSHEIRTPMNAIMGFSSLLVDNYGNKPKLEMFSEIIRQRSSDLLNIINDILDIAKIESGQLTLNMEMCDLNDLFAELTIFFKAQQQQRIGKENVKVILQALCNISDSLIVTDKVKLKQIFINLIGNALKFTETGTIEGGCKIVDNKLMFYVADTGIGIAKNKQKVIFERFEQINPGENKLVSGTGLGLAIVKGLVDLLGGQLSLESEIGKGSIFTFTIAFMTAQPNIQENQIVEQPKANSFTNKTILIVEDDYFNAEYLKEILSNTGINILTTEYGNEAIQIATTQPIDIVLMDIRLPDMDGYEATHQIKQIKPELTIIAQTAYASNEDRQKALDLGCNDYISKPTKRELLLNMIGEYL